MPRLIDADELEKDIAELYFGKSEGPTVLNAAGNFIFDAAIDCAISRVQEASTIDAVPVVRCKDCKYFEFGDYCYHDGVMEHSHARENDFCSYGKRRKNNATD